MLVKILVTMVTMHSHLINQSECTAECAQIQMRCITAWMCVGVTMYVIVCCVCVCAYRCDVEYACIRWYLFVCKTLCCAVHVTISVTACIYNYI